MSDFGPPPQPVPDDPSPYPGQPRPPASPLRARWLLALPAAFVLCLAGSLIGRLGGSADVDPPPRAAAPAETTSTPTPEPPAEVIYEVTVSGPRNTGDVTYTDQDGEIIRRYGIPLPWRTTFTSDTRRPWVIQAQRLRGGDTGPVTCTITMNGKVLATTTATGGYASASCTG